jgi:tetratricopeptide (TPR) repeat protein
LSPNNRFILRSATRFFIHTEQFEKAIFYLRKSESIKKDPWLISAHIATSSIIGRFSPFIKDGMNIINSMNYSNFEITELASSLGTLEFKDGSFKKARLLFDKSMKAPNDNSLAQLEWISKEDYRFSSDPFLHQGVINPFEAYALDFYEKEKWEDAFYNCIKWFLDVPFSKRPVLLGSFIAGSFLKDRVSSILLCEVGLKANPYDPTLLNNIIYNLAISNKISELGNYVNQLRNFNLTYLPNETKVTIQATLGLVAFRTNDIENGIKLYELSIQNAEKINNSYLKKLALLNYTRELVLFDQPQKVKYLDIIKSLSIENTAKDLLDIQREVIELSFNNIGIKVLASSTP